MSINAVSNAGAQSIATSTDIKVATTVAPDIKEQTAAVDRSTNKEIGSTIVTLSDGSEPETVTYGFGGIKQGPP